MDPRVQSGILVRAGSLGGTIGDDAMDETAPIRALRPASLGASRLRTILVLAVVTVLVTAVAWYLDQPSGGSNVRAGAPPPGEPPRTGDAPPDFQATAVDGSVVSMAALKGQPIWLTIGATWCPDCRAEAPDLQATYAKFKPQGLAVLGIFIQEDDKAVVDFAKRIGFDVPDGCRPAGEDRRPVPRVRTPVALLHRAGREDPGCPDRPADAVGDGDAGSAGFSTPEPATADAARALTKS